MTRITFIGHATVEVRFRDKSVLIDPFISDNPSTNQNADDFTPDAILLTHGHEDHTADALPIAKRSNCPIVAMVELAEFLQSQGAPNGIGMNIGGPTKYEFGTVALTPAFHSSSIGGKYMGMPSGVILTTPEGFKIYHAGDTGLFSDMQLIGEEGLDVAIIPIGSHFTMDPKAAAKAVELLRPKYVIPVHYNTFPPIEQDAQAFKADVEGRTSSQVIVLNPGESHEF